MDDEDCGHFAEGGDGLFPLGNFLGFNPLGGEGEVPGEGGIDHVLEVMNKGI